MRGEGECWQAQPEWLVFLQRIPAAAGGENPQVPRLDVQEWLSSYSQAMHQSLRYLFAFPLPQCQGSGALSTAAPDKAHKLLGARLRSVPPGRDVTHLHRGLKFDQCGGSSDVCYLLSSS